MGADVCVCLCVFLCVCVCVCLCVCTVGEPGTYAGDRESGEDAMGTDRGAHG